MMKSKVTINATDVKCKECFVELLKTTGPFKLQGRRQLKRSLNPLNLV